MSDDPFFLPGPPQVTAAQARETARLWKGMADHLASLRDGAGMRRALQESQWWMTYSVALGQSEKPEGTPPP